MRILLPVLFALTTSPVSIHAKIHPHKRAVADLCANVDGGLGALGIANVNLKLCLCASAIPTLITTNDQLGAAADLLGTTMVTAALTALINGATPCPLPAHAVPTCTANACNFTCIDGFTPFPPNNPTECICTGTLCNGVCGIGPCSSQRAKRSLDWKHPTCPHGWSACGIWGGSRGDYECVDVRRDLWSCGGCGFPLRHTDPSGIDCTAIPRVLDVECLSSRCVVHRCKEGFHISPDRSTCTHDNCTDPDEPPFLVSSGEVHYRSGE